MRLDSQLTEVKGIGPAMAKLFSKLGLETVQQLLAYYPRRYDDYSQVIPIVKIKPGTVTIKATIKQAKGRYIRGGLHITEAVASDETSSIKLVWFNQPYRAESIKPNTEYYITGPFAMKYRQFSITNPVMELASSFPVNTARIVPVYRETKGLTSSVIRKALKAVFEAGVTVPDPLPPEVIKENKLLGKQQAIYGMHFPDSQEDIDQAKHRLGFEEVWLLIVASLLIKREIMHETALAIPFDQKTAKTFVGELPFALTDDQRRVIWQIYKDIDRTTPMNRLVEGDVGSGKTVVAVMAAIMAMHQGYQVAFMAPTELLARQHAETIYNLLNSLGMGEKVALLVGGMTKAQKDKAREGVKNGQAQLIIGTHALIQDSVDMHKLALVIIDEQHRFGVEQRKKLLAKAGHAPHLLSMTATPIPRSLALALYGEMDVSIISTKPKNRKPIVTKLSRPTDRLKLYKEVDDELAKGRQMFVVCPLIEQSDALAAKSAEEVHKDLSTKYFAKRKVGLLHGKMKAEDKNTVMQQFIDKKLDILVSTTVIEVGVDVPNATIMMLEAPERFGLAQIHQLRGRVGRGEHQGYCYLLLSDATEPSKRLRAIASSNDGFELAELDLRLRGPGAMYGTLQHGFDLKVADFTDIALLRQARASAQKFIESTKSLVKYKQLSEIIKRLSVDVHLN